MLVCHDVELPRPRKHGEVPEGSSALWPGRIAKPAQIRVANLDSLCVLVARQSVVGTVSLAGSPKGLDSHAELHNPDGGNVRRIRRAEVVWDGDPPLKSRTQAGTVICLASPFAQVGEGDVVQHAFEVGPAEPGNLSRHSG